MGKLLLVEDDELLLRSMKNFLGQTYELRLAPSAEEALEVLKPGSLPDLVLLDVMLPEMSGMELLGIIKEKHPTLPVVMLTAIDRIANVVEAIRKGAADYLVKPFQPEELLLAIDRALETREIRQEITNRRHLQLLANKEYELIGPSKALRKIREEIAKIGPTPATVLVEGETGTGKEIVSRALHAASARAGEAFVPLNCGAIPKDLIESELFGHQRGAFTGADSSTVGKFRLAHKGTLLLDEVGELSSEAQVKLLRVLEEQEFYPVGSHDLQKVDVRVVASTNRDLKRMVEEERFRSDLYFRLNTFKIVIPPLRERPEDVVPLAESFLRRFGEMFGKRFDSITSEAQEILQRHPWKGNVRELRNLLERVVLSEEGPEVREDHLYFIEPLRGPRDSKASITLPEEGIDLETVEKTLMVQALERTKNNKTRAAKLLNLSPPTFYYRLEKYGLK